MVRTRIYTLNLKIYKCNKTLEKLQGKYSREKKKKLYRELSYIQILYFSMENLKKVKKN